MRTRIKTNGTEIITTTSHNFSVADELAKIAKLREQRVITEEEFKQLKEKIIRRL